MSYVVLAYDPTEHDSFNIRGTALNGADDVVRVRYSFKHKTEQGMQRGRELYFAASKYDAEVIADAMAKENPGKRYVTAKLETMIEVQPGPRTLAQFTERGLLPINQE